ncbi:hypothetical protein ACFV16_36320 [Streptomyces massasporeus]|uniref:hypothetical protein n=1 Tax=Streptomyces massasporeus TaxID=67324 RepID=UPI00368F613E
MSVSRRSVLLASAAAPAAGTLLGASEAWAAEQAHGASGRRTVALRDGWRFALVNPGGITDPTGAYVDAHLPPGPSTGWTSPSRWTPRTACR